MLRVVGEHRRFLLSAASLLLAAAAMNADRNKILALIQEAAEQAIADAEAAGLPTPATAAQAALRVEAEPDQTVATVVQEEVTPSKDDVEADVTVEPDIDSPSRLKMLGGLVRESSRNLISRVLTFE